jgi:putative ATP-dependent endonuclease of the OLD family
VRLAGEITTAVGSNAAGKTALLQAVSKLFGVSRADRDIHRSDFHLAPDEDPDDGRPRELFIECLIGLPELLDGTATPETIAPSFRHMRIEREGEAPVCRLRLEARWEDDGTVEGEVSQELFWVDTLELVLTDAHKHPVSPADRGLVQLYYTPASRDPRAQIRATTGALAARLLRAIEWSTETQEAVTEASEKLSETFDAEDAIDAISKALERRWEDLHDEVVDTTPRLSLMSRRFEEVISRIAVIFKKGPDGSERGLDALSEGQQSLFYFALASAVFDLERQVIAGEVEGFRNHQLRIPALTIFALEEPENHLSPYFLSRIIRQVRSLTSQGSAQAIMTSHSPAVLSRVKPSEVRYCRCDSNTRCSSVKSIVCRFPSGPLASLCAAQCSPFPNSTSRASCFW